MVQPLFEVLFLVIQEFDFLIDSEDSKELSVVIHTVKHNYITSIITMRVLTTTYFGPTCGPSSGCN